MKNRVAAIAAVGLTALVGACGQDPPAHAPPAPPPTGVLIRIDTVIPRWFEAGREGQCVVAGQVVNNAKYRVESIAFDAGGVHIATQNVRANDHTSEIELATVDVTDANSGVRSCADVAQRLAAAANTKPALDCNMAPNVPEGDCQKLTVVAFNLPGDVVRKVQAIEAAQNVLERQAHSLQQGPVSQALRALLAVGNDDVLVDFLIRTDAKSWFMNRYDEGSAHVTAKRTDPVGGDTILHADFRYVGGEKGWVNVRLHRDVLNPPCLEFEDTNGSCNILRHPDGMNEPPPPPAPPPPAPPVPPAADDQTPVPPADPNATPDQTDDASPAPK